MVLSVHKPLMHIGVRMRRCMSFRGVAPRVERVFAGCNGDHPGSFQDRPDHYGPDRLLDPQTVGGGSMKLHARASCLIGICLTSALLMPVFGDGAGETYFDLTLEQLLNLEISSGTITDMDRRKIPVSVTVITAEDIALTPARNIYDLLEVYVPGALWMNHHEGPHPGIRGIIADRNYKFLLLVNGINMNQKAHNGATSELEHWNLDDIKRIEIIRGPGSVTYGPGAVMAVINIVTRNAESREGLSVGAQYYSGYNSRGASFDYGATKDKFGLYMYGSVVRTPGFEPDAYTVVSNDEYGYVGEDITSGPSAQPPLDYFADFDDEPQKKFHVQLDIADLGLDKITLTGRYTEAGMSANGVSPKVRFQDGLLFDSTGADGTNYYSPTFGELDNHKQLKNRHLTASLDLRHELPLADGLQLKGMLVWDTEDHTRNQSFTKTYTYGSTESMRGVADPDNAKAKRFDFAEDEIMGRLLGVLTFLEKYQVALGVEGSRNHWHEGWGDEPEDMRMGDQNNIVTGPNSEAIGDGTNYSVDSAAAFYTGEDGWYTNTYSFLFEANLEFAPVITVLLSGRLDKDTYSSFLFSPRIALISEVSPGHVIKLLGQQSNRMNTAEALYVEHVSGAGQSEPEKLTGAELLYNGQIAKALSLNAAAYYNMVEILSFGITSSSEGIYVGETKKTGDLQLAGLELELAYANDNLKVGLNYSYCKQLKWELEEGVDGAGISYGSYDKEVGTYTLEGVGNDLNNWSNHAIKAFASYTFADRLTLHIDGRIFPKYEGAQDGLTMLDNLDIDELSAVIDDVEDKGTYGIDARLNASARLRIGDKVEMSVYVLNLLGANGNKRYSYDAGISKTVPHRVAFVEEPRSFGLETRVSF